MEMASVSPDAPPLDTKTDDEEKEPKIKPASFSELFQFATCGDLLTLFVGYFFAFGGGAGNPLMLLALADLWQSLGSVSIVSGVMIDPDMMMRMFSTFVFIGLGMFVGRFVAVPAIEVTTSRMMLQYKRAYL